MRLRKRNSIVHYSYLPTYSSLIAGLITPLVPTIKLQLTSLSPIISLSPSCLPHHHPCSPGHPFPCLSNNSWSFCSSWEKQRKSGLQSLPNISIFTKTFQGLYKS